MPRRFTGVNVFDSAVERLRFLYEDGHRVVVCFSAGKDSCVCLELCKEIARATDRLPVEVVMRDEEILLPGSFEYAEQVAMDPEIDFHWLIQKHAVINVFNREDPYFWTFDDRLAPSDWVREPPYELASHHEGFYCHEIDEISIEYVVDGNRYPPPEGKRTYRILGLRTSESPKRNMGLYSSKGWLTQKPIRGVYTGRPIYDWSDADVWKAILNNEWPCNLAYNTMYQMKWPKPQMRIGPPTLAEAGIHSLRLGMKAFPEWFERVCNRLPGVRQGAMFGKAAVRPTRKLGETWQETYQRSCIDEAPVWIAERAEYVRTVVLRRHESHSTQPLPEIIRCVMCKMLSSWKHMTISMYNGDPFLLKAVGTGLNSIEPEFFRDDLPEGKRQWGGKATF